MTHQGDYSIIVVDDHEGAAHRRHAGIDNDDMSLIELRFHAVAQHPQGVGLGRGTTACIHHSVLRQIKAGTRFYEI